SGGSSTRSCAIAANGTLLSSKSWITGPMMDGSVAAVARFTQKARSRGVVPVPNLHLIRPRTRRVHGPQPVLPRHRGCGEVDDGLRVPAVDELPRPRLSDGHPRSRRGSPSVLPRPRRP